MEETRSQIGHERTNPGQRYRGVVLRCINASASGVIVLGVLLYRATLGHVTGGHCRYMPTCSQYMLDAVRQYGPWRGGWRGLKRIARCHPWGGGGYDPA